MFDFNEKQFEQKVQSIFFDCFRIAFNDYFPKDLVISKEESKDSPYLTKKEAAKLLSCSVSTIDNYRRAGTLKRYNFGSSARFKRSELLQMIEDLNGSSGNKKRGPEKSSKN